MQMGPNKMGILRCNIQECFCCRSLHIIQGHFGLLSLMVNCSTLWSPTVSWLLSWQIQLVKFSKFKFSPIVVSFLQCVRDSGSPVSGTLWELFTAWRNPRLWALPRQHHTSLMLQNSTVAKRKDPISNRFCQHNKAKLQGTVNEIIFFASSVPRGRQFNKDSRNCSTLCMQLLPLAIRAIEAALTTHRHNCLHIPMGY